MKNVGTLIREYLLGRCHDKALFGRIVETLRASGPVLWEGSVWSVRLEGDAWILTESVEELTIYESLDDIEGIWSVPVVDKRPDAELARAYNLQLASAVPAA